MKRWLPLVTPFVILPPLDAQTERGFGLVGRSFFAVQTDDLDAAVAWYGSVLGLEELRRLAAPDGRYAIAILSDGGLTVELIRSRGASPTQGARLGLFKAGFYVDDIEAAHRWLLDRAPRTDRAISADEAIQARTFVFRDLDGNRLQAFETCPPGCGPMRRSPTRSPSAADTLSAPSRGRWIVAAGPRSASASGVLTFADASQRSSEGHRRYRTGRHVEERLSLFDTVRDLCNRPDAVELAIWPPATRRAAAPLMACAYTLSVRQLRCPPARPRSQAMIPSPVPESAGWRSSS
jgi:catechol 2,3-dioxygenase-like lactoylglutathione lyase family enzyme